MLDVEKDLRQQGIITPDNKVKQDVYVWGSKRIRIYTNPREYKYMSSSDDEIACFITLEDSDPWQRQVLQILEKFPDY